MQAYPARMPSSIPPALPPVDPAATAVEVEHCLGIFWRAECALLRDTGARQADVQQSAVARQADVRQSAVAR